MQLDREQAKRILSASFREDESPHASVELEAALEMLDADAELAAWFDQELAFDSAVAESLAEIPVPEGLREACLESVEQGLADAESGAVESVSASSAPSSAPRRPFLGLLLAVSAVVVLAALGAFRHFSKSAGADGLPEYADFRSEMVDFISDRFALGFQGRDFENLNDWVASEGGTRFKRLPKSITGATSVGCNLIEWGGGQASLFCFMGGQRRPVHVFVAPISDLTALPDVSELAQQVDVRGLKTVAWQEDGLLYMLCGSASNIEVSPYLGGENVAMHARRQRLFVSSR